MFDNNNNKYEPGAQKMNTHPSNRHNIERAECPLVSEYKITLNGIIVLLSDPTAACIDMINCDYVKYTI